MKIDLTKKNIRTGLLVLVAIGLFGMTTILMVRQPFKADVPTSPADKSIFYGTVSLTNGQPAAKIIVTIGGSGVQTSKYGTYFITVGQKGRFMPMFYDDKTKKSYQITRNGEQAVDTSSRPQQIDFTIEPVGS